MIKTVAALLCAGSLAFAAPKTLTGGPAELDKEMDARAAKIGKVGNAAAPFAVLARKKDLIRVAFGKIYAVERTDGNTGFIGERPVPGGFEYAHVIFAGDVELSTRSAAVAIGAIIGAQEMVDKEGKKAVLPVFDARVLGVIGGGTPKDGRLQFAPKSLIRVYEAAAKKAPAKK